MITCHQRGSMINSIPLFWDTNRQQRRRAEEKGSAKKWARYLSAAILSLATGPFGKYQQLTDIIYGPVLYPTGTVCPERNFKMKATDSEVPQRNFLLLPAHSGSATKCWHSNSNPQTFPRKRMLDIWNLDIKGEKSNAPLVNSYQIDFLTLKDFLLWYKQRTAEQFRPWARMPPVADEPYGGGGGGGSETANYCDQEILKIQPFRRGGTAQAPYDMKKGSQCQRRWGSTNPEHHSGLANLEISDQVS